MKTIKLVATVFFIAMISTTISSCEGEIGPEGNANVQTYIFDSPTWTSNEMIINLSALTTDVLDNDVVLGYWKDSSDDWASTNDYYWGGYLRDFAHVNEFSIRAYLDNNSDDTTPPTVAKVKIIIIDSSNTTTVSGNGRMVSSQQAIHNELEQAGVDINNYNAVCNYYGINPQ